MMPYADIGAAFLLGLLSLPHCLAMCGGVAAALMSTPVSAQKRSSMPDLIQTSSGNGAAVSARTNTLNNALANARQEQQLLRATQYGIGKLMGYMLLGAIAGVAGAVFTLAGTGAGVVLRVLAGALLIAAGLYAADWWRGIRSLERISYPLWRSLGSSLRTLDLQRGSHRILAGVGWGLIPCGIVYSATGLALATGSAGGGALIMLGFGLGTLPFVLMVGGAMASLQPLLRSTQWKTFAGTMLVILGAYMMFNALLH